MLMCYRREKWFLALSEVNITGKMHYHGIQGLHGDVALALPFLSHLRVSRGHCVTKYFAAVSVVALVINSSSGVITLSAWFRQWPHSLWQTKVSAIVH